MERIWQSIIILHLPTIQFFRKRFLSFRKGKYPTIHPQPWWYLGLSHGLQFFGSFGIGTFQLCRCLSSSTFKTYQRKLHTPLKANISCVHFNKQPFRLGTGGDWGFRGGDRGQGASTWRCLGCCLGGTGVLGSALGAQASRIRGHKRHRNP